ncbi:hypothetical protein [Polaribacter ponticola]|uniref:RHS repeat protein n=1 Tax=Polaribacter ponticola TaxID=2978475 RepID=A0ABT5S799_9FLAO|nr:hypothetical protein [Polaribacter sp. MSW5]MDD7913714.1 hypothetical protein [Polaribacter sp. MSW5]
MKKLNLSIKAMFIASVLFISCTENDPIIEEETCIGDNYTIEIDRLLTKLTNTHPGNLPTIRNYEYTYNSYNLLAESKEYTFDYDEYRIFNYPCNNNLSSVTNENESLKYTLKYDELNRLVSYKTTNSYLHDYELTYSGNTITVSGLINKKPNTTITIETTNNLVTRIIRSDNYSTFEYDTNGNLIKARDYDNDNTLLKDYKVSYDSNPNPFYGQFKSSYLERFIDYFSKSAFYGIDNFFRFNQSKFPYLKNNPVLLEDLECTNCYKDLLKRTYEYDSQNYPLKMEESHVGAPAVIYEYQYN